MVKIYCKIIIDELLGKEKKKIFFLLSRVQSN